VTDECFGVAAVGFQHFERTMPGYIRDLDQVGATDPRASTLEAFQRAFEKAWVVFLEPGDIRDGGEGAPCVRQL